MGLVSPRRQARWKWRRKSLKKLIPAMEMAQSGSADVDEGTTGIDATKGQSLAKTASVPPKRDTL